jgi:hypothetical protein
MQQIKRKTMTAQKTAELKQMFEYSYTVTVTVAPNNRKSDDDAFDKTYESFDEALNDIRVLENSNTVYF